MRIHSVRKDAARLSRMAVAHNVAQAGALGFSLVTAYVVVTTAAAAQGALLDPTLWLLLGPLFATFALAIATFWLCARALRTLHGRRLAQALFCVSGLLWLLSMVTMGRAALVVGGVWGVALLAAMAIAVGPLVLMGLGLFSIPGPNEADPAFRSAADPDVGGATIRRLNTEGRWGPGLLIGLSMLAFAGSVFIWLNLNGWIQGRINVLRIAVCPADISAQTCLAMHPLEPLVIMAGAVALTAGLAQAAHGARRAAYAAVRRSATARMIADSRPPVVFLRSFPVDAHRYEREQDNPLIALCDIGRAPGNFDHLLVDEASRFGPVIAIGDPRSSPPVIGVARDAVGAGSWQDVVRQWVPRARMVVIAHGDTPGVSWEIEETARQNALSRTLTLFVSTPSPAALKAQYGVELPPLPSKERLIAILGSGETALAITSAHRSYEAYKLALHLANARQPG